MDTPLEVLKGLEQKLAANSTAAEPMFQLLPALTQEEVRRLEKQIPCPIPTEAAELFRYARGFRLHNPLLHGGERELSDVDLSGLDAEFVLEGIFPYGLSVADDGCGNYWVVDLTRHSDSWGPIFFVCHDPAVVVYQTQSLARFMEEVVKGVVMPERNELHEVHEELTSRIWIENPGVLSFEECANSEDEDLKIFAASLDASYEFIDLRTPELGDGFAWGRYGPSTVHARFAKKRIFAYQKRTKWERFKEFWKR